MGPEYSPVPWSCAPNTAPVSHAQKCLVAIINAHTDTRWSTSCSTLREKKLLFIADVNHTYTHIYIYIHIHICAYTYTSMLYTYTHAYVYTHSYTRIYVYVYIYTLMFIYTYTYTYIYVIQDALLKLSVPNQALPVHYPFKECAESR